MSRQERIARARIAVDAVIDPVLGRRLDELGMVTAVAEERRRIRVEIALPVSEHQGTDQLRTAVQLAVEQALGPCRPASVVYKSMTPHRRAELGDRLRATTPSLSGGLGTRTRVYAVASGKGGVGKSTVTANLAAARAAAGERVGILDADVWGHSIPHMFGVRTSPRTLGGLMLPVTAHGVALMSVGFFVEPDEAVMWRGPMLHKALEQFLSDTWWGELDVLFVDLPPGTGDITMSLTELVPDAALLAVTTPGAAAVSVARRVVRAARDRGMPVAGIIENMSAAVCGDCGGHTAVFGEGGGDELAALAEAPLLARIPLDIETRRAADRGVPVVLAAPDSVAARAISRAAPDMQASRRSLVGRALPLSVV